MLIKYLESIRKAPYKLGKKYLQVKYFYHRSGTSKIINKVEHQSFVWLFG